MRVLLWVFVLAAATLGCRSGTIDTVAVENPAVSPDDVEARPTATVEAPATNDAESNTGTVADTETSSVPTPVAESVQSSGAVGDTAETESAEDPPPEDPAPEDAAPEDAAPEDLAPADSAPENAAQETVDLGALDVGVEPVTEDDSWCTAAAKLDSNYRALNEVDSGNPTELEAAFRQVYDSIELAAELAPPEISANAEVERWVWDRVVTLHADANWDIASVAVNEVVELSEANLAPMQAIDDYTAAVCG